MPDFNREMAYAGAEFSLQIFEALGVLGFSFGESHPDAAKRLTQMHIMMRRNCETDEACQQVTALARSLSGLLAEVIKILELPREHEFSHEARQIISELDNLPQPLCGADAPGLYDIQ